MTWCPIQKLRIPGGVPSVSSAACVCRNMGGVGMNVAVLGGTATFTWVMAQWQSAAIWMAGLGMVFYVGGARFALCLTRV
jgi:hypothetical protein